MIEPETVTYIAGVARSGTSWLGQVFNSAPSVRFRFQPLFAYEFKGRVNEDSSSQEFKRLTDDMFVQETPFLVQKDKLESGLYPKFVKESKCPHLVFKENRYQNVIEPFMRKCPNVKLVGLVRNPNAVLNSWMQNEKEFPPGSEPLTEWRYGLCKNNGPEDFFGYYKWKEVANLYLDLWEKWPDRVVVVQYEQLVEDSVKITKDLFKFCGIPYSSQTEKFLRQSSRRIPSNDSYYSVFKSKNVITKWKSLLDPYIVGEIENDLRGTRLERFLKFP